MGTRSQHAEAAANRVDLVAAHTASALGSARVGMCDQAERHLREALREHGRIIDNLEWVRAGRDPKRVHRSLSAVDTLARNAWSKSSQMVTAAVEAVDGACSIRRR